MTETSPSLPPIAKILLAILFLGLTYGAYLSYKSIDFAVLNKLESIPFVLPTPIISPAPIVSPDSSPSATPSNPAVTTASPR